MSVYEISNFSGGISDFEDRGIKGAFKFGSNLDIRKLRDTLSAGQALVDEGTTLQSASASRSPSASASPSASNSHSPSRSPSASPSPSLGSASASQSPSASRSPSSSASPSASVSPSSSGSSSPSPSGGLKTVFSDLIIKFVKCSDGYVYGFGHLGKIYKRTGTNEWKQVYDARERITGAEEKPSSGGSTYLTWASLTDLHIKPIPGNASWNDVDTGLTGFPKTNLTSTTWHTMANVGGDIMIANYNYLAMLAYDNSFTNEALDLIPGNIAKTIVERGGRAVIGTYRASDPDKGVNGSIDAEVPLSQVGNSGEIYYADFSATMPVKKFPGGGKVNPSGVANLIDPVQYFDWETNALSWIDKQSVGNMALFGVYGATATMGGIYTYGRKDKNHPFVLNLEHQLDVDEIGAICSVGGVILASYRDGTDYGVKAVDSTAKATGTYEGLDFKAPVKTPINITTWKLAELFMDPLPSGASVQFWYKLDKTGSFIRAYTADGNLSYSVVNGKKAVFRIMAEGQVFEPKVVLVPTGNSTPEVHRIRIYFE